MTFKPVKPEDVLPDDVNVKIFNDVPVRKATVAASLANVEIIENRQSTIEEKAQALAAFKALVPSLKALGFPKYLIWKNPEIQALFDEED